LIESVYAIKPRQVEAVGLPVLWELLRTPPRCCSDPEVRDAARHYAATMAQCFGTKTLLELSTFRINPREVIALPGYSFASQVDVGCLRMPPKSKYVIVQLASVISGSTRIWIRERTADKFRGIFYDPAIGREVLFEEKQKVKGKATLPQSVKDRFNLI
ncbi:unnamed protein product, partial [Litomosoides sigmodontis]